MQPHLVQMQVQSGAAVTLTRRCFRCHCFVDSLTPDFQGCSLPSSQVSGHDQFARLDESYISLTSLPKCQSTTTAHRILPLPPPLLPVAWSFLSPRGAGPTPHFQLTRFHGHAEPQRDHNHSRCLFGTPNNPRQAGLLHNRLGSIVRLLCCTSPEPARPITILEAAFDLGAILVRAHIEIPITASARAPPPSSRKLTPCLSVSKLALNKLSRLPPLSPSPRHCDKQQLVHDSHRDQFHRILVQ